MSELYTIRTVGDNSLQHYGVLGMKWGHRKSTTYSTNMKNAKARYKVEKKRIDSRYTKAAEKYDKITKNGSIRNKKAEDAFERSADRWAAQRKTARKNYKNERKTYKDFEKVKKASTKAMNVGVKAYNFQRDHTYRVGDTTMTMVNKRMVDKSNKLARKANKMIDKLNKKYGNVSVTSGVNTKTGKNYIDVMLGNNKERIYENYK